MADVLSREVITREEVIGLGVLAGAVGVGIILLATGKGGQGQGQGLPPGTHSVGLPILTSGTVTDASGAQSQVTLGQVPSSCPGNTTGAGGSIRVPLTGTLTLNNPQVCYEGIPNNFYTYAQLTQMINGRPTAVYASGVAGVALGADHLALNAPRLYPLVAPDQPQPNGSRGPFLTLYNVVQAARAGIAVCGSAAQPGSAILTVAIYGPCCTTKNPADCANPAGPAVTYCSAQDGFSSPTCNARIHYVIYQWTGTVTLF